MSETKLSHRSKEFPYDIFSCKGIINLAFSAVKPDMHLNSTSKSASPKSISLLQGQLSTFSDFWSITRFRQFKTGNKVGLDALKDKTSGSQELTIISVRIKFDPGWILNLIPHLCHTYSRTVKWSFTIFSAYNMNGGIAITIFTRVVLNFRRGFLKCVCRRGHFYLNRSLNFVCMNFLLFRINRVNTKIFKNFVTISTQKF